MTKIGSVWALTITVAREEPHLMRRCGLQSTGEQQNPRIRNGVGWAAGGGAGFYSCGRVLFFSRGCGVLLALDGRRNCGRRILGGGWGSDPASFRPTRDFWPSDPEGAVAEAPWAVWAFSRCSHDNRGRGLFRLFDIWAWDIIQCLFKVNNVL